MREGHTFLEGLRDAREVWYRGERVEDVVEHEILGTAARHVAADFDLAGDSEAHDLAVTVADDGKEYSTFWHVPRNADDLRKRSSLIEASTAHGATLVSLVSLVREIGSDALFALHRVTSANETMFDRVSTFYRHCRDDDLAVAVAQTDVKGDRSLRPAAQADPDLYVRVVERRSDGLIVRGAKVHTSCTPYVDEVIVVPTRALAQDEQGWVAIPTSTPGLKLFCSDYLHSEKTPWTRPISTSHKMIETLTVFEDVFVPNERVFLDGETDLAGELALTFVEYHRFTAVSYKLPLLDLFVGLGAALAEANGISKAGHVRDKLTWLIGYAETVRGLAHLAAERFHVHEKTGIAYPDPLTTNLAKWTFARDYHRAVEHVIDLAGGLLVTGPGEADWASQDVRAYLDKYLVGAVPADRRLALINLASEVTARDYAGYQKVLAVHAGGSLEAEKLMLFRSYNPKPARELVDRLAQLPEPIFQEVNEA